MTDDVRAVLPNGHVKNYKRLLRAKWDGGLEAGLYTLELHALDLLGDK